MSKKATIGFDAQKQCAGSPTLTAVRASPYSNRSCQVIDRRNGSVDEARIPQKQHW